MDQLGAAQGLHSDFRHWGFLLFRALPGQVEIQPTLFLLNVQTTKNTMRTMERDAAVRRT
ncbi:hypothetical protein D9M68_814030 [compost metagenome]